MGLFFKFSLKMVKNFVSIGRVLFLALSVVSLSLADNFNQSAQNGFRYGPNLSWGLMGNTPFVWGQWLPQAVGSLHYVWVEPLEELNYGEVLGKTPTYLKMDASVEVSPFYAGYTAGLGLRPFKTNPQLEVDFMYENYLYTNSNLEMVTADVSGSGRIAETWNADYIVDNVRQGDSVAWDYAQLFDVGVSLEYFFRGGSLMGTAVHYVLSDITTDFEGKSYDYKRNMPIFNRDFLLEVQLYGRSPFNENIALLFEANYFRTGYLRSKGGTVEKESLGYGIVMAGCQLSWDKGLRSVTLEVGGWSRHKSRFYDGSVSQELLVQLEYEGYFSFPFSRNFTK